MWESSGAPRFSLGIYKSLPRVSPSPWPTLLSCPPPTQVHSILRTKGKWGSRRMRCPWGRLVRLKPLAARSPTSGSWIQAVSGTEGPRCPGTLGAAPSRMRFPVCPPSLFPLSHPADSRRVPPLGPRLPRPSQPPTAMSMSLDFWSWTPLAHGILWEGSRAPLPGCPTDPADLCATIPAPRSPLPPIQSYSSATCHFFQLFEPMKPLPLGPCIFRSVPAHPSLTHTGPSSAPCAHSQPRFRSQVRSHSLSSQDHTPAWWGELPVLLGAPVPHHSTSQCGLWLPSRQWHLCTLDKRELRPVPTVHLASRSIADSRTVLALSPQGVLHCQEKGWRYRTMGAEMQEIKEVPSPKYVPS